MNNNKKKILVVIGIILVILIATILFIFLKVKTPDSEKIKNEYERLNSELSEDGKSYPKVELPSTNIMKYADIDEIIDIFHKKENAVIYFGYSTCLYCRSAIEVLCDVASSTDLDTIYYLNIEDYWDVKEFNKNNELVVKKEANSKYKELLDILGEELITEYTLTDKNGNIVKVGDKRVYVPLVIFVVKGDIISYNKGTLFSQDDPYTKLDDSQIEGLSEIYRLGINNVLGIEQS
ncbi:MAG: hypothetical protein ACI31S_06865 [Bacilli bacterium]